MSAVLGVVPVEHHAPQLSEEAVALQFAQLHSDKLRYVDVWKAWFVYDGQRWKRDQTRHVFSLSRELCRSQAGLANDRNKQLGLASARTRAAVVSLASDDRALAASIDQWDADPWLLNTPDGAVDLRTGQLQPAKSESYFTKITAVGPGTVCPNWTRFLQTVTGNDDELIRYLQRIAGYCLTGLTSAHALFFVHGLGANGKSVFISTLSGLLGDYHRTAAVETFTASNTDRHPTELAMLQGARLVTAVETEEGRGWAESRIKALTGGDKISARFMRQDFFEYVPQFKLLIAGNHKPGLRTVDEAIRRRFNLIPFSVTIKPEDRNVNLVQELKAEWPGILSWAIEGALSWQTIGLEAPEKVIDATKDYLSSEDAFEKWKDDCCLEGINYWEPVGNLFGSWKWWAEEAREHIGSERRFSQTLIARGYKSHRSDQRGFYGLKLKRPPNRNVPEPRGVPM